MHNNLAYAKAAQIYESIAQKNELPDDAILNIAECYRLINNIERAKYWYKKAVEIEDIPATTYYYYAQILKSNEEYEEADKTIYHLKTTK